MDRQTYRATVLKVPIAVNFSSAGNAAGGTAVGHTVGELGHVGRLVLACCEVGGWVGFLLEKRKRTVRSSLNKR